MKYLDINLTKYVKDLYEGLPWWLSSKESVCQHRRREFAPGLGRSHTPHHVPQLLRACALEPMLHNKSYYSEKPAHRSCRVSRRGKLAQQQRPSIAKNEKLIDFLKKIYMRKTVKF